jgi:hypothetical protein
LCAGILLSPAAPVSAQHLANRAYYEGRRITLNPVAARHARKLVVDGTLLGPVIAARKPRDRRPNLYVLSPGTQYGSGRTRSFNLIVNRIPRTDKPVNWDVYWALVLDPALRSDFVSERQLLIAAQGSFSPGEAFSFDAIPTAHLLRAHLHIDSLDGLESFRRANGELPRLVIVPAQCAIRAQVVDPERRKQFVVGSR